MNPVKIYRSDTGKININIRNPLGFKKEIYGVKIEDKLYSIGQASNMTGIRPYVLRYWEKEFNILRPIKGEGGQRRYRKEDIETILYIKELLYQKKYTIAGAKKKFLEEAKLKKQQSQNPQTVLKNLVKELKKDLRSMSRILNQ